jgi:hypothetical protein
MVPVRGHSMCQRPSRGGRWRPLRCIVWRGSSGAPRPHLARGAVIACLHHAVISCSAEAWTSGGGGGWTRRAVRVRVPQGPQLAREAGANRMVVRCRGTGAAQSRRAARGLPALAGSPHDRLLALQPAWGVRHNEPHSSGTRPFHHPSCRVPFWSFAIQGRNGRLQRGDKQRLPSILRCAWLEGRIGQTCHGLCNVADGA